MDRVCSALHDGADHTPAGHKCEAGYGGCEQNQLPWVGFGLKENPMEWIKELSDKLLLWLLRRTSRFERELTAEGRAEQALWREQRLRNLKGLALRSREHARKKAENA